LCIYVLEFYENLVALGNPYKYTLFTPTMEIE
jgi:hypothetical protein